MVTIEDLNGKQGKNSKFKFLVSKRLKSQKEREDFLNMQEF